MSAGWGRFWRGRTGAHGQLLLGGLGAVDDGEVRHHSGEHLVDPDG